MATLRQRNKRHQKLAQMLGERRTEAFGLDKARDELQRSRDEVLARPPPALPPCRTDRLSGVSHAAVTFPPLSLWRCILLCLQFL